MPRIRKQGVTLRQCPLTLLAREGQSFHDDRPPPHLRDLGSSLLLHLHCFFPSSSMLLTVKSKDRFPIISHVFFFLSFPCFQVFLLLNKKKSLFIFNTLTSSEKLLEIVHTYCEECDYVNHVQFQGKESSYLLLQGFLFLQQLLFLLPPYKHLHQHRPNENKCKSLLTCFFIVIFIVH